MKVTKAAAAVFSVVVGQLAAAVAVGRQVVAVGRLVVAVSAVVC